jgi:hypothetical protein
MWLFTKHGFFSVVTTEKFEENMIQIRARRRVDLVDLLSNAPSSVSSGMHTIIESRNSDYPFRIIVTRATWETIAVWLAEGINYHNFKGQIRDANYSHFALTVWEAGRRMLHKFSEGTWR